MSWILPNRFALLLAVGPIAACSAQLPPAQEATALPRQADTTVSPEPVVHPAIIAAATPAKLVYELPGVFTRDTSVADLKRTYGETNVVIEELDEGEGQSVKGAVIFPNDDTRRAEFYFRDPATFAGLHAVRVSNSESMWRILSGVGVGTRLEELEKVNGRAFDFSGFDWDYGGTVLDWHGGKLQPAPGSGYVNQVQLEPKADSGEHPYPVGDSTFSSADAAWAQSGIVVDEIGVGFE